MTHEPEIARSTAEFDLESVRTRQDLAKALNIMHVRAGRPALRDLEKTTVHADVRLSRTVISEMLRGMRLASKPVTLAFVRRCGVSDVRAWESAWQRVAVAESLPDVRLDQGPRNPWHFDDGEPVTIVCAALPPEFTERMPYSNPVDPDYVKLYGLADVDALVELYGHVRALNPASHVEYLSVGHLETRHYTEHLVLLGGIDWNADTRSVLSRLDVPVRQVSDGTSAYFEVLEGDETVRHHPQLKDGILLEDVAHLYRAPNPYRPIRTLTICNGAYARGVLGAVRALTDARVGGNIEYLHRRFGESSTFSILMRVMVMESGTALTPDWTAADTILHEWPPS